MLTNALAQSNLSDNLFTSTKDGIVFSNFNVIAASLGKYWKLSVLSSGVSSCRLSCHI